LGRDATKKEIYYNLMRPPSYMRSVVDRNVVRWHMTVFVRNFLYS